MRIRSSPRNGGSARCPLPNTTCAAPCRKIDPPMVMMINEAWLALRARSMASFSSSRPASADSNTASATASGSGAPAETSITEATPPIMMNSPWAKLITPLVL